MRTQVTCLLLLRYILPYAAILEGVARLAIQNGAEAVHSKNIPRHDGAPGHPLDMDVIIIAGELATSVRLHFRLSPGESQVPPPSLALSFSSYSNFHSPAVIARSAWWRSEIMSLIQGPPLFS